MGPEKGVVDADEDAENENRNRKLAELETLLSSFEKAEIPLDKLVEPSLEDPVLLLLAQHWSFRICRRDFFCPEENCRPKWPITTLGKLISHLKLVHRVGEEETADMVRYFLMKLLPGETEAVITAQDGQRVKRSWDFCRYHHPGCSYVSVGSLQVDGHMQTTHESMTKDVKKLGWFWGAIHTMIKGNPRMTIAEALGPGDFWECTIEGCHKPFQSEKALRQHFTKAHARDTREGWVAASRRLTLRWKRKVADPDETGKSAETAESAETAIRNEPASSREGERERIREARSETQNELGQRSDQVASGSELHQGRARSLGQASSRAAAQREGLKDLKELQSR
jgi:hypothetical protein